MSPTLHRSEHGPGAGSDRPGFRWINRLVGSLYGMVGATVLARQLAIVAARFEYFRLTSTMMSVNLVIGLLAFVLLCWGAITIIYSQRKKILFLNLLFACYLAVLPPLLEGLFRIGISAGVPFFRRPGIYANPYSDDDYFKLIDIWQQRLPAQASSEFSKPDYDPLLGWAYRRDAANPLGIFVGAAYEHDPKDDAILFFGASYATHGRSFETTIPHQLDRLLPGVTVYNYGVGGFGLDQSYLRFRSSHLDFENPFIVFGIETQTIDRCVLKYRNRPKPFFRLVDGELALQQVPVPPSRDAYLREHPLSFSSYFLAATRRFLRYVTAGSSLRDDTRKEEKEGLARKIIEEILAEARRRDLGVLLVIFSDEEHPGWRRDVIVDQARAWGVPYLDTTVELHAFGKTGVEYRRAYMDETGHHTTLANTIIAQAIARCLTGHVEHFRSIELAVSPGDGERSERPESGACVVPRGPASEWARSRLARLAPPIDDLRREPRRHRSEGLGTVP